MRIAFFSDFSLEQVTGISDVLRSLMQGLNASGHETCLFAPSEPTSKNASEPLSHVSLPSIGLPWAPTFRFTSPFGIPRSLRDFQPDILHTQTYGTVGHLAVRAARALHVPLVGTQHTLPAEYARYVLDVSWMRKGSRMFAAHYYQKCDCVTAPSQMVARELKEDGVTKDIRIIHNPLEVSLFRPMPDRDRLKAEHGIRKPSVLCFGRLAPEKNIEELFAAFALLRKNGTEAELEVVGSGPAESKLRRKALSLGIEKDVRFLGTLRGEPLVRAINAMDAYAIASRSENQSMTVMQSMACGLPVVGVNCGGLPEFIRNGENGYIVEGGDVNALAARLAELLADPAKRAAFGKRGRAIAEENAPQRIMEQMETLYSSLI